MQAWPTCGKFTWVVEPFGWHQRPCPGPVQRNRTPTDLIACGASITVKLGRSCTDRLQRHPNTSPDAVDGFDATPHPIHWCRRWPRAGGIASRPRLGVLERWLGRVVGGRFPATRARATCRTAALFVVVGVPLAATTQFAPLQRARLASGLEAEMAGSPATAGANSGVGGGWTAQASGMSNDLRGVDFVDRSHGWAVGARGWILATTDGGAQWVRQSACEQTVPCTPTSQDAVTADLASVSFTDATHGWAVGATGTILATSDGGRSWSVQLACAQLETDVVRHFCTAVSADRVTKDLTGVSFVDRSHGWAVGKGEQILATSDGGATWTLQIACSWQAAGSLDPCPPRPATTPARDLNGVSFASATQGWAVGTEGYSIRTDDGGHTWTVMSRGPSPGLDAIELVTPRSPMPDIVHAVGVAGEVAVGAGEGVPGAQWWYPVGTNGLSGRQPSPSDRNLNGVSFTDHLNGFVVGDGGVAASSQDGGLSWTVTPTGTTQNLFGVSFPDANDGWAVGARGTILAMRAVPARVHVLGVTPDRGPTAGTRAVTLRGEGFTGAREVNIGRFWADGFTVNSDTSITAWLPTLPAGQFDVTVVTDDGTSLVSPSDRVTTSVPVGGSWTTAPACPPLRCTGPAVRLPDGRVLVEGAGRVGGPDCGDIDLLIPSGTNEAELFDPTANAWSTTAPMLHARALHSAVGLGDGRVLVAGGYTQGSDTTITKTAEIFDPRTSSWTATAPMHVARAAFAAVRLADGRVLVAGGSTGPAADPSPIASAEIYDPSSGRWTEVASMHNGRSRAGAVVLPSGRVLVVGGGLEKHNEGSADGSAELFDPATGTWTETGSLTVPRNGFTLTLLDAGEVLAAGGWIEHQGRDRITYSLAELYSPESGTWRPTGPTALPRAYHSAAVLPDGRVLVTGGAVNFTLICGICGPLSEAEVFDSAAGSWTQVSPMPKWGCDQNATLLEDGRVLLSGGAEEDETTQTGGLTPVYTPTTGTGSSAWETVGGPVGTTSAAVGGGLLLSGVMAWAAARRRGRAGRSRREWSWGPRPLAWRARYLLTRRRTRSR